MRRAVAVLGDPGQVRSLHRFPGAAAFDRGGVNDPDIIAQQAGRGGQIHHDVLDDSGEVALAFVVAGLLRDVGKDAGQVLVGVSEEASFGGVAEQGFHDRQGNQFGVADPGRVPGGRPGGQEFGVGVEVVVGGEIKCCCESVQVVFHKFDP